MVLTEKQKKLNNVLLTKLQKQQQSKKIIIIVVTKFFSMKVCLAYRYFTQLNDTNKYSRYTQSELHKSSYHYRIDVDYFDEII